jgi:hypothetical protein
MDGEESPGGFVHACRLPGVQGAPTRDIFDNARLLSSVAMALAGIVAVVGSALDWVTFTVPDTKTGRILFQHPKAPVGGFDAHDGKVVLVAAIVLGAAGLLLAIQRRGRWAVVGLLASVVIGAVAISDYRSVGDASSVVNGIAHVAPGLTLVAISGLVGLIGSVIGITATPRRE